MSASRPHPLIDQLRFARREFLRGVEGVSDADGAVRLGPMNCLAWNVGHLAWQEQRYFLTYAQGVTPDAEIAELYRNGAPGFSPSLADTLARWRAVTAAADPWLDALTTSGLEEVRTRPGRPPATVGNLVLRTVYHYWYHCGENQAIRQQLGHTGLPQFVGNIDDEAPYRSEVP